MNPEFERIFQLREARDMETDREQTRRMSEELRAAVDGFLRQNRLPMTRDVFWHTLRDDYKNWLRNKH